MQVNDEETKAIATIIHILAQLPTTAARLRVAEYIKSRAEQEEYE